MTVEGPWSIRLDLRPRSFSLPAACEALLVLLVASMFVGFSLGVMDGQALWSAFQVFLLMIGVDVASTSVLPRGMRKRIAERLTFRCSPAFGLACVRFRVGAYAGLLGSVAMGLARLGPGIVGVTRSDAGTFIAFMAAIAVGAGLAASYVVARERSKTYRLVLTPSTLLPPRFSMGSWSHAPIEFAVARSSALSGGGAGPAGIDATTFRWAVRSGRRQVGFVEGPVIHRAVSDEVAVIGLILRIKEIHAMIQAARG